MNLDTGQVTEWLRLYLDGCDGLLHVCSNGDWTGRRYPVEHAERALGYLAERDRQGTSGLYLRATTLVPQAPSDHGRRAGAQWSASLPGLWADIDIAGPGHKHEPNHPGMPGFQSNRAVKYPLPADEGVARHIVEEAGLLKPTLWVHSGGGLYPWWLMDEPLRLAGDEVALEAATALSEGWQRLLVAAGRRLGVDYGNVGDLARVMRIPGTPNRKLTGVDRPCRVLEWDGPRYRFDELLECQRSAQAALDAAEAADRPEPVAVPTIALSPTVAAPQPAGPRPGSPLDAFEENIPWEAILKPHGWTISHVSGRTTYWVRPGKRASEGHAATTGHSTDGRDRMWVFSTMCGLPTEEPLTKPFVWGVLNGHGSDMKRVAKALVSSGFGTPLAQQVPHGFTTPLAAIAGAPAAVTPPPPVQPFIAVPQAPPPPEVAGWHPNPVRPGETGRLPAFPVDCLPPVMADLVRHISASRQVDPIMSALFSLSTISAVAAGKLQVRRNGDWFEALSLYTCTVAESGERKSPVGRPVFGAVGRIEKQMAAAWNDEVDQKVADLDQERANARGNPAAANRLEDKIAAVEASRRRPPRIRLADDITPEALARALSVQGGHGAILDPEGTFMGLLSGRYSSGNPNPELVIKAYDGDTYTTERISREGERIARPTLAIGMAVQQIVIDEAMGSRHLLERGALARFIYGFPPSLVGTRWERNAAPHDPAPARAWALVVEGITELPEPEDRECPPALALSPEALAMHSQLTDAIEARLAPGGDLTGAGLKEWSHKHAGRVLRLAALLHLGAGLDATVEIQPQAMAAAIVIGEWCIEHARHAHRINRENEEEATAKQCSQVLDWVLRTGQAAFTNRQACRGVRAQWVSTKSMEDAIDQLIELGWLREEPYQDRAGRWRKRFAVSPFIHLASRPATM